MALQGKKIQICNVYQFLWYIFFHLGQGQPTNIIKCSSGKKCTLPSPAFTSQHQLALSRHCNACLPDTTFKASAMEQLMFLRDIFKYIKLSHYKHISVFWTYKWQLYIFSDLLCLILWFNFQKYLFSSSWEAHGHCFCSFFSRLSNVFSYGHLHENVWERGNWNQHLNTFFWRKIVNCWEFLF